MNLPNQAMPVQRGGQVVVRFDGVNPSGNCGRGYWCCVLASGGGPQCVKCATNWLGICIDPAIVTCALYGGIPSNSC